MKYCITVKTTEGSSYSTDPNERGKLTVKDVASQCLAEVQAGALCIQVQGQTDYRIFPRNNIQQVDIREVK